MKLTITYRISHSPLRGNGALIWRVFFKIDEFLYITSHCHYPHSQIIVPDEKHKYCFITVFDKNFKKPTTRRLNAYMGNLFVGFVDKAEGLYLENTEVLKSNHEDIRQLFIALQKHGEIL